MRGQAELSSAGPKNLQEQEGPTGYTFYFLTLFSIGKEGNTSIPSRSAKLTSF